MFSPPRELRVRRVSDASKQVFQLPGPSGLGEDEAKRQRHSKKGSHCECLGEGRPLPCLSKLRCSSEEQTLEKSGGARVQPRLIQGIRSGDGVGEDQDTITSIRY